MLDTALTHFLEIWDQIRGPANWVNKEVAVTPKLKVAAG